MADNVSVTPGSGATVAAEDVGGGVLVQRVKTTFGAPGAATDVSTATPLPVTNAEDRPFQGIAASTVGPFPVSTTSTNAGIALPAGGGQVRVAVTGTSSVRIAWGTSNATTATTPTPGTLAGGSYSGGNAGSKLVAALGVEILSAPAGTTYVAFKTDSGTSTVEFTPGAGA